MHSNMETSCDPLNNDEIQLLRNIIKVLEDSNTKIRGFCNYGNKTEDDWKDSGKVKILLDTERKGNHAMLIAAINVSIKYLENPLPFTGYFDPTL